MQPHWLKRPVHNAMQKSRTGQRGVELGGQRESVSWKKAINSRVREEMSEQNKTAACVAIVVGHCQRSLLVIYVVDTLSFHGKSDLETSMEIS